MGYPLAQAVERPQISAKAAPVENFLEERAWQMLKAFVIRLSPTAAHTAATAKGTALLVIRDSSVGRAFDC